MGKVLRLLSPANNNYDLMVLEFNINRQILMAIPEVVLRSADICREEGEDPYEMTEWGPK